MGRLDIEDSAPASLPPTPPSDRKCNQNTHQMKETNRYENRYADNCMYVNKPTQLRVSCTHVNGFRDKYGCTIQMTLGASFYKRG